MDLRPPFIPDAQAAKLIKPREGSLHHPSPSAQSPAMLSVSLGEPRQARLAPRSAVRHFAPRP